MKKHIEQWIAKRNDLINNDKDEVEVDRLEACIVKAIKENFYELECDFILESMTHLGAAPSVLYDDNGMWAVIGDGTQPALSENERLEGLVHIGFFLERKDWHSTIRAALKHYLFERTS